MQWSSFLRKKAINIKVLGVLYLVSSPYTASWRSVDISNGRALCVCVEEEGGDGTGLSRHKSENT